MKQGLQEVIVKDTIDNGYTIQFGVCIKCGTQIAQTEKDKYKCSQCGSTNRGDWKPTERLIHPKVVQDIISRKLMYQCPKCHKRYDKPTPCCVAETEVSTANFGGKERLRGYFCPGCRRMYTKIVECCTGWHLHAGWIYLDPKGSKKTLMNAR
jgi:DNA-directed RNA polymerase subunit RPC12/RpoP